MNAGGLRCGRKVQTGTLEGNAGVARGYDVRWIFAPRTECSRPGAAEKGPAMDWVIVLFDEASPGVLRMDCCRVRRNGDPDPGSKKRNLGHPQREESQDPHM
jgi:hypothetical protein